MHIISRPQIHEFWNKHADSETALKVWFQKTKKAQWNNLNELKIDFPSADYIGNDRYVFNIKGNKYRLVAMIFFDIRTVFIRFIGTHAEYDKINCTEI